MKHVGYTLLWKSERGYILDLPAARLYKIRRDACFDKRRQEAVYPNGPAKIVKVYIKPEDR